MLGVLRKLGVGLLAAFLPSPERDRLALREGVEPFRWSVFLGLVQGAVGLTLYCSGALGYMEHYGTEHGMWVLENYGEIQEKTGRAPTRSLLMASPSPKPRATDSWKGKFSSSAWRLAASASNAGGNSRQRPRRRAATPEKYGSD